MKAICSRLMSNGKVQTVSGTVIQRGLGKITLILTGKDGSRKIRKLDESKYTVRIID